MNITSTSLIVYWLYKHIFEFTADLDGIEEQRKVKEIIDRMGEDEYFHLELFIAVLTGIQFGRLVFTIQMSRTFGPMVKILGSMLVDLMIFMMMNTLIFFIFS